MSGNRDRRDAGEVKQVYGCLAFLFRFWDAMTGRKAQFPPKRVFFVRTHALGDVLLATAAVRAVKRAWPETHTTMIVGRRSLPALEGNPYIDSLESFPEEWWFQKKFPRILRLTLSLRRKPKDALVILHASSLIHLWGFLLRAPIRVGFDEDGSGFALTHCVSRKRKDDSRYLGDVNLDLVRALGVFGGDAEPDYFPKDDELQAASRWLGRHRNAGASSIIGIAPGGGHNAFESICVKHWPAGHFADLMRELSGQRQVEYILFGDNNDDQVDEIMHKMGGNVRVLDLKGKTTYRELAAVICHLDVLITNDSSPLHLAVALKKPVVALFGPTANRALFPPGHGRMALQSPAPCSPCYSFGRFPGCPAPYCMAALPVQAVREAVESLLGPRGNQRERVRGQRSSHEFTCTTN
jgi:ADP-heptose:LPS heptosyltransferase